MEQLISSASNPRVANKYDCDCGRSPNGKCLGWHKLNELELLVKKNFNSPINLVTNFILEQSSYKISN